MGRKLIILCIFVLFVSVSFAQQMTTYSQYMFDKSIVNAAYVGSSRFIHTSFGHKEHFMGFDQSPTTSFFTFNAPIQKKYIGLGMKIISDKVGISSQTTMAGLFAYHLGFGDGKLSAGLEGGLYNNKVDFTGLVKTEEFDDAIPEGVASNTLPDASFGLLYQSDLMYYGFSVYNLISSRINFTGIDRPNIGQLRKHYFILAGYTLELSEKLRLEPSLLLKLVGGAPGQFDLNARATVFKMFTVGASYRLGDSFVSLFQLNISDRIKVGYAYDTRVSRIANSIMGGQEFMLTYSHKLLPPAREKEISPRYYIK